MKIMAQIPSFLPLNSPWPIIEEAMKSQYLQWLNAFCDYMTKRSAEFSRQSVRKKKFRRDIHDSFGLYLSFISRIIIQHY
jgi:hypothetical protein